MWAGPPNLLLTNRTRQKWQVSLPRPGCKPSLLTHLRIITLGNPATMMWGHSSSLAERQVVRPSGLQPEAVGVGLPGSRASSPSSAFWWLQPADIPMASSRERPCVRTTQLRHSWIPDPQKLQDHTCFYHLRPPSSGAIQYAATENECSCLIMMPASCYHFKQGGDGSCFVCSPENQQNPNNLPRLRDQKYSW